MKLKAYRLKHGITGTAAAAQLGISRMWLNGIETGRSQPGADLVERIGQWSNGKVTEWTKKKPGSAT